MRKTPLRRLGAFALAGIAAAIAVPASAQSQKPAPAPKPAPQSEGAESKRDYYKEQERLAKERAEKERAEKERAQKAQPGKTAPAAGAKPAPTNPPANAAEQRDVAKKAAKFEHNSRIVQARIDRLIRIYKQKGDTEKVRKLEAMKAQQQKRTDNAMAGFRKKLGEENWGRLNSEMQKHHGRDEHQKERPAKTEKTRPAGGGQ
jgi:hypothetical protein